MPPTAVKFLNTVEAGLTSKKRKRKKNRIKESTSVQLGHISCSKALSKYTDNDNITFDNIEQNQAFKSGDPRENSKISNLVTYQGEPELGDCVEKLTESFTTMNHGKRRRRSSDDDIPSTCEYVALDCEFVGVGTDRHSELGRCSVVNFDGHILCDIYSKPDEPVTDYRTRWSGIRPRDLVNAVPFENARNIIRAAIKDRILVGHALHNDLKVLMLKHAEDRIRDTSQYVPLRVMANLPRGHPPALRKLSLNLLGKRIQKKEHSSVEDSRATMDVFKLVRLKWEREILEEENGTSRRKRRRRNNNNSESSDSDDSDSDDSDDDDTLSFLADLFWPEDVEY